MSTVEAAASLFGSADPASDPFASLGSNDEQLPHGTSTDIPFGANTLDSPNSSFFDTANNTHDPPKHSDASHGTSHYSYGWENQQNSWQHDSSVGNTAPNGYGSSYAHSLTPSYPAPTQATPHSPYEPPAARDSRAPTYAPAPQPSYAPPQPSYQSQYSPAVSAYAPPAHTPQAPPPSTYGQPDYSSYTPVSSAFSPPPAPYGAVSRTSSLPPPPPQPASTPLNRPKVSNAYDPPLPPSKPARRVSKPSLTAPFAADPYALYSHPTVPQPLPPQQHQFMQTQSPPPVHQSYTSPPLNHGVQRQGEYVSAYSHEYAAAPPPPAQPSVEGLPPIHTPGSYVTNHTKPPQPPPPPFRRPPSRQIAEQFGPSSRPSSRAISRTSSPLASHVYSAPHPDDAPKPESSPPVPKSPTEGAARAGSKLTNSVYSASSFVSPGAVGDEPDPEGGESLSSGWPADADKTILASEEDQNRSSTLTASPPPNASPVMQSRVPPAARRSSAAFGPYGPPKAKSPPNLAPPGTTDQRIAPPTRSMSAAPDAYAPNPTRVSSPPARSASAVPSNYAPMPQPSGEQANGSLYAPFAPPVGAPSQGSYSTPYQPGPPKPDESRSRSSSYGSVLLNNQSKDPYAPPQHSRRSTSESTDHGVYSSPYNYPKGAQQSVGYTPEAIPTQELTIPPTTRAPYAPSPSLLGTNDPLGRTNARAPVFTFGFGGKVVTCFHGASLLNTGFDIALSSRKSTTLQIRDIKNAITETALDVSTVPFPGPLFCDPGSPTSLVRTGLSSQTKTKKAKVIKYLEERVEELQRAAAFLHPGAVDRVRAESKTMIVSLLKVMVENDGKLTGSPSIDSNVRNILLGQTSTPETTEGVFTTAADLSDQKLNPYDSSINTGDSPLAVTTLQKSMLEKIQDFLTRGERRQAYHYALDRKLWGHALVIASSIDKDSWNEAVTEFIRAELVGASAEKDALVSGWEGLRTAYSAFAGQGAAAVGQLIPQSRLSQPTGGLLAPLASVPTPATPHFSSTVTVAKIPEQTLLQWARTLAMLYTTPMTPELSATLTALGDQLAHNGWIEAAHVCYLLSPQTSAIGGAGNSAARIVLLGGQGPQVTSASQVDPDPIIFTEILEFAMSLSTPAKGQESFGGFPHLQAFRLARAATLAERGEIKLAQRYCEAIVACTNKPSPYFGPDFLQQLKAINDRIIAAPHVDKGSWISGKVSKPSLDTLGTWFESSVTKLITGDGDLQSEPENALKDENTFDGPFSQFGTISSATPSTSTSPQASSVNLSVIPPPLPGPTLVTNPYAPINRSASAMDYTKRRDYSTPQVASAGPLSTSFPQTSSFGQGLNGAQSQYDNPYGLTRSNSEDSQELLTPKPAENDTVEESTVQEVTWWGSSAYGDVPNSETPTAATFHKVDSSMTTNNDGFISLMDDVGPFSATPSPPVQRSSPPNAVPEDEEDLGLGNSKRSKKAQEENDSSKPPSPTAPKESPAPAAQPTTPSASSGSWFGRLFGRSGGPIKASLGEETAFYYDKELKRWVNKKAGAEEAKPAPPPPPPRAQTAAPAMDKAPSSSSNPVPGTPPMRATSVLNGSGPPPNKTIPRIRSNLVPSESASAPPTPSPGATLAPPKTPVDRPRSSASKRNVRSRYVDVFQADETGA